MRRRFWNSPLFLYPLSALALLLGAIILYLLPWTSHRETEMDNRAFRSLSSIGDQVGKRLASLEYALRRSSPDLLSKTTPGLLNLECPASSSENAGIAAVQSYEGLYFRIQSGKKCLGAYLQDILGPILDDSLDDFFDDLVLADESGRVIFQTQRKGVRIDNLSSLVPSSPETSGKSNEGAGAQDKSRSSLAGAAAHISPSEPPAKGLVPKTWDSSQLLLAKMAGTEYRFYFSPITPIFSGDLNDSPASTHLVVAGILENGTFRSRAQNLSPLLTIRILLAVAIIVFGSAPILKFFLMRRTERISRGSALLYVFSTVVTIALLNLLILHEVYMDQDQAGERGLENLTDSIERNVPSELLATLKALDAAESSKEFQSIAIPAVKPKTKTDFDSPRTALLTKDRYLFATYSYLDQMFWADGQGNQRIKWTVRDDTTPQTNVQKYGFFRDILDNNLWTLTVPKTNHSYRFRVEPLYSENTAEYFAVIARPVEPTEKQALRMAALIAPLTSLINPVLPPDYGFAIVDETGTVLFHSISSRNQRENFFSECGSPDLVRSAVASRSRQTIRSNYHGSEHEMMIRPLDIQDCPWSVIAFHDRTAAAAYHVERIIVFGLELICFIVLLGLAALLLRFVLPSTPSQWVWPTEDKRGAYRQMTVGYAVFAWATTLWFSSEPPLGIFVASLALGVGAFLVGACKLNGFNKPFGVLCLLFLAAAPAAPSQWPALLLAAAASFILSAPKIPGFLRLRRGSVAELPLDWSYASCAAWAVIVAAVAPSIGFFKVATDYESLQFLKRDQLLLLHNLERRADTVVQHYSSIRIATEDGSPAARKFDPLRAVFLRQRLLRDWDRYDGSKTPLTEYSTFEEGISNRFLRNFTYLTASLVPNEGATLARLLARRDPKDPDLTWIQDSPQRLRLSVGSLRNPNSAGAATDFQYKPGDFQYFASENARFGPSSIVSTVEPLQALDWRFLSWFVGLFILLLFWLRFTIRRLFVMDLKPVKPWPQMKPKSIPSVTHNVLALTWPRTGTTTRLRNLRGITRWDMADILKGYPPPAQNVAGVTVIDNFDFAIDDPEANQRKLEILERLLGNNYGPVVVVTSMHPSFFFSAAARLAEPEVHEYAETETKWKKALHDFDTVVLESPGPIDRTQYDALWWALTPGEQAVLNQLARDGWPNYKNKEVLEHLIDRGLVIRDPVIRISDPALASYITDDLSPHAARSWESLEGPKAWDGLKLVLGMAGAALLILILFLSQQENLAWLTTAVSSVASGAKIISDLRGKASGASGVKA